MKKILFIINSLNVGGAEKSLVSLLNLLPPEEYEIDLYLLKRTGLFLKLLPANINVKEVPFPYTCLSRKISDVSFFYRNGFLFWFKKVVRTILSNIINRKNAVIQNLWARWKDEIPVIEEEYDVAVSYIEGSANYFVIDKIKAKKKYLWMHTIYDKWGYSPEFDKYYFNKADKVVTISNICKDSLIKNFPDIASNKFAILENITSQQLIKSMSEETLVDEIYLDKNKKKILSVGRLDPIKAYDLALDAAKILKERGVDFVWYIVGGGKIKEKLEKQKSDLGLDNEVYFIGAQMNPYKYMRYADIVVQSSKYEGKSIVLDEAKLLGKPIVATNYSTVTDAITHLETGIITEMFPESLANGICELLKNKELRNRIIKNISLNTKDNTCEIDKYIELF
ncbi:MAG: glycosyltransferase [Bacteroidaceae bacterium]|nr:glycosyltransferase [Bacteroidaceae bacterium]